MLADRPTERGLAATGAERGESNLLRRATLADALRNQARRQATKEAIVAFGTDGTRTSLSYQGLDRAANRLARRWAAQGVGRGDVITGMSVNSASVVVSMFAALRLGAVYSGLNVGYTASEIVHQLRHSRPRLVLAQQSLRQRIEEVLELVENPPLADIDGWDSPDGEDAEFDPFVHETDEALLIYTSGTESRSKGVLLSHRGFLLGTAAAWSFDGYLRRHDRFLLLAPMFTAAGLGTILNCIVIGATIVTTAVPDAGQVLAIIGRESITNMSQTPAFYRRLLDHPDLPSAELATLEQCHTYGGLSNEAVFTAMSARVPQMTWATYWGQTELSQLGSIGYFRTSSDIPGGDSRWIGSAVPLLDARVVDEEGRDAELGELVVRSPAVMIGYLGDEERTQETLRGGWLRTGDLVRADGRGNLFFHDRRKDMIKTGGMNVASIEVEQVISGFDGIAEVAVVGLPDEQWSEVVTAFVVPTAGSTLDEAALDKWCRAVLASYKVPKRVVVLDALPRDAQGKVRKRELRPG